MTSTSTLEWARNKQDKLSQVKTSRLTKFWCHLYPSAMTYSHFLEWWAAQESNLKAPLRSRAAVTKLNCSVQAHWLILKTTLTSAKTWAPWQPQRLQMFSPTTVQQIPECSKPQKAETRRHWLTLMPCSLWWTSTSNMRTNLVKTCCSVVKLPLK